MKNQDIEKEWNLIKENKELKEFILEWLSDNIDKYELEETENGWVIPNHGFYETLEQFLEAHYDEVINEIG